MLKVLQTLLAGLMCLYSFLTVDSVVYLVLRLALVALKERLILIYKANILSFSCCKLFADVLNKNKTLETLNLESNFLTGVGIMVSMGRLKLKVKFNP